MTPVRELSEYERWYGRDEPPATTIELRAGRLSVHLDGIDLRYVRLGELELARRVCVAVRDRDWGTVAPQVSERAIEIREASFTVKFRARHEEGDLSFSWAGVIEGHNDGAIEYTMDGSAEGSFGYQRIGLCVLHPRELSGCFFRLSSPETKLAGYLPGTIGQQRFEDGRFHALFPPFDRLEIDVDGGTSVQFAFAGDLFELEDQRNWTDASFKTYSTPLGRGGPHRAEAGDVLRQAVRIATTGSHEPSVPARVGAPVRIQIGSVSAEQLPAIGFGMSSEASELGSRVTALLRGARPAHLRVELDLGRSWREALERGLETARALNAAVELVVSFSGGTRSGLGEVGDTLAATDVPLARVVVFDTGRDVSDSAAVKAVRDCLGRTAPGVPFAAGTNLAFAELNRARTSLVGVDLVAYSVCATVHADDDTSVLETPAAQGDTVRSARALAAGRPVAVGPITMRPRLSPQAALAGSPGLPFQVDPRQCSLFGAAWTVASLKYIAEAGAVAATYFETIGWRGLIESEDEVRPGSFPSWPGQVFPLYHVLADAGEWRERSAQLVPAESSDPLAVVALAIQADENLQVLIANLKPRPVTTTLAPIGTGGARLRILDDASFQLAGSDPTAFRATGGLIETRAGKVELTLGPHAIVRLDLL